MDIEVGSTAEEEEEEEEEEERGEQEEEMDDAEDLDMEEPLPPPRPEQEKELLFLIEFMVDTLTIKTENMNTDKIDPCALQGPSRVSLIFLHFPPMLLRESDMDQNKRKGGNEVEFNAGKSLMFALTEDQFEDPPPIYLVIEAAKEMPHAFRFPFLDIGKTKIQLSELFKKVFEKYDENPGKTVSKSIKDKYDLIGVKGKPAGEISLYVRLTCLGENIVTEFQKAEDIDDTTLFKNKESKKIYECRETDIQEESLGKTLPGWGDDNRKICVQNEIRIPLPDPEDENFEEIFAEINGSAISVTVEKGKRKEKAREFHISDFCDCNIPLPQHLVAGMSDLSLSPASEASMSAAAGANVTTDKRVGLDSANQLVFTVPPVELLSQPGKQNNILYNVKTCQEGVKHGHKGQNSFRVITGNNPEGPVPQMPNDPEKDVFVLRIIKRMRKDKGKDTLELEFKTPKEKIVAPPWPPYMIEKGTGPEKKKKPKKSKKPKKV